MQWVVLGHGEGLVSRPVHVQGHARELHVEHVVVPLLITDLPGARDPNCQPLPQEGLLSEGTTNTECTEMLCVRVLGNMLPLQGASVSLPTIALCGDAQLH